MKEEIPDKLKIEVLNDLSDSLSFIKTNHRFPMVSLEDIQRILRESAELYKRRMDMPVSDDHYDFILETDGACKGNPGESGAGVVIHDVKGNATRELKKYLGMNTNNTAEYRALIYGLEEALKLGGGRIRIFSDSELMVKQLKGTYSVRNKELMLLHKEVNDLLKKFDAYDINHINREQNRHADRLANDAIDQRST
ncbi:MAG: ribonuclease HI family protein [Thermodesulfobacteriota bacterium]|nr:ribonuclease HI family protein [Thermodesulfobacteriota bacterium]